MGSGDLLRVKPPYEGSFSVSLRIKPEGVIYMKLIRSSHAVGEANYHLQLTPKYRRKIFNDEEVKKACEASFRYTAAEYGFVLAGVGFGPDHVHVFLSACKNIAPAKLVQLLKGRSSRELRRSLLERLRDAGLKGKHLWTAGYFYRSVGAVTSESMYYYVQHSQGRHWEVVDYEVYKHRQKALTDFTG